jgi:hypothetical protein
MRSASFICIVMVGLQSACGGSSFPKVTAGPMPENGSFTGVYHSPQYGEMQMVQNGSAVVGKYKQDERSGTIQGEANGDVMRFEWTEYKAMVSNRPQTTRGHAYFKYMVDASNGDHVLKGRWGLNDDDSQGGEWNAYKMRTREPDLEHFATDIPTKGGEKGSSSESESGSDQGGKDQGGDDIF